jgi:hypothetical protein
LTIGLDDISNENVHIYAVDTHPKNEDILAIGILHEHPVYFKVMLLNFNRDGILNFGLYIPIDLSATLPVLNFYPGLIKYTNNPDYCVAWRVGVKSEMMLIDIVYKKIIQYIDHKPDFGVSVTTSMLVQFSDDTSKNDMYVIRVSPSSEFYLSKFEFRHSSSTYPEYKMLWSKHFPITS